MATNVNTLKDLGNGLYSGGLIALGVIGAKYAGKSMGLKDRPVEMKIKSLAMLGAEIGVATFAVQKLQAASVIPAKIFT